MKRTLLGTKYSYTKSDREFKIEFWGGEVAEVDLISYPSNALDTLLKATRGYDGIYSNGPITDEQRKKYMEAIPKSALSTQMEMLNFVFLVRDVPRSLTHQMVRTRIGASYVQESTRFMGKRSLYRVLVPKTMHIGMEVRSDYIRGNVQALTEYENLVEDEKVAPQDARNLFPHGVLTNIFVSYTLKTFAHVFKQRFCCAAEQNWYILVKQMRDLIRETCGNEVADLVKAPVELEQNCGYNSSLDRPCTWRKR